MDNKIKVYGDAKPFITQGLIDRITNNLKGSNMTSEKLMKIVQAINDSKGEPVDIEDNCRYISRANGWNSIPDGEVHATNVSEGGPNKSWIYICTVEEFYQCVKEMSAGYGNKETKMKDNKHPHHDLIVEWAKDTSKTVQVNTPDTLGWFNVNQPAWNTAHKYRFKPREFTKGHWYPCIDWSGKRSIYIFTGEGFAIDEVDNGCIDMANGMLWIGESLGEINFG